MADENTITLTEAELQAKIDEAVSSATKDLTSKHNKAIAELRVENKELKNANLSSDERAKQELEEQKLATEKELSELRAFKKSAIISERLAKENLPSHLKNDIRLINATDETFDKALKQVKSDYESSLPKGNSHSSVVQVASTVKETSSKETAYAKMGEALNSLLGK